MEKPNGQICNVFGSRNNKDRRTKIRSFSVFEPNTPILQYSNTPDLHPGGGVCAPIRVGCVREEGQNKARH